MGVGGAGLLGMKLNGFWGAVWRVEVRWGLREVFGEMVREEGSIVDADVGVGMGSVVKGVRMKLMVVVWG